MYIYEAQPLSHAPAHGKGSNGQRAHPLAQRPGKTRLLFLGTLSVCLSPAGRENGRSREKEGRLGAGGLGRKPTPPGCGERQAGGSAPTLAGWVPAEGTELHTTLYLGSEGSVFRKRTPGGSGDWKRPETTVAPSHPLLPAPSPQLAAGPARRPLHWASGRCQGSGPGFQSQRAATLCPAPWASHLTLRGLCLPSCKPGPGLERRAWGARSARTGIDPVFRGRHPAPLRLTPPAAQRFPTPAARGHCPPFPRLSGAPALRAAGGGRGISGAGGPERDPGPRWDPPLPAAGRWEQPRGGRRGAGRVNANPSPLTSRPSGERPARARKERARGGARLPRRPGSATLCGSRPAERAPGWLSARRSPPRVARASGRRAARPPPGPEPPHAHRRLGPRPATTGPKDAGPGRLHAGAEREGVSAPGREPGQRSSRAAGQPRRAGGGSLLLSSAWKERAGPARGGERGEGHDWRYWRRASAEPLSCRRPRPGLPRAERSPRARPRPPPRRTWILRARRPALIAFVFRPVSGARSALLAGPRGPDGSARACGRGWTLVGTRSRLGRLLPPR